jgi:hypothetical protein
MPDLDALRSTLRSIEAIADKGPEWSRSHLADLVENGRSDISAAALRADERGFRDALERLALMVRRYVFSSSV